MSDPCVILRELVTLAEQADNEAQAALDAAQRAKGLTALLLQGARQSLIDAGCDDPTGQQPSDEEPTVDGLDADLGMGEPSSVPRAYEQPKE